MTFTEIQNSRKGKRISSTEGGARNQYISDSGKDEEKPEQKN